MNEVRTELSPERRALLARKGEILYGKFCGTRGQGICAESFAVYQLRIGNPEVDFEVSATHIGLAFNPIVFDVVAHRLAGKTPSWGNQA